MTKVPLHLNAFHRFWGFSPECHQHDLELGFPYSSLHYPEDGLLKIDYVLAGDEQLIIENITFSEDYTLVNALGETVSYKLEDQYLPR